MRVLADPVRLRILSLVLTHPSGEIRRGALSEAFDLTGPTVSHHLTVLCQAGLLDRERRGTGVYYRPTHRALANYASLIAPAVTDADQPDLTNVRLIEPPDALHRAVLDRIARQLAGRFAGVFSEQTVARYVQESYEMLAARARIRRFLPSLTANFAAERLTALAQAEGRRRGGCPEVLFVCVQNAGRSQMAAGLLEQLAGEQVHVRSAGSAPVSDLTGTVWRVMDEVGVHMGREFPKPLTDEVVRAADYVITMGCGDACPVFPGKRYLDWPIADPAGRSVEQVRAIRDAIDERVHALAHDLLGTSA
ncbi:MAG: metalloregulator ArsR/SmtB family transcription factor [Streptosporangiales bacterium]|nr:metalloregulator ArsR/SmtB family transcription factor [Streptosporangiales bacterium]